MLSCLRGGNDKETSRPAWGTLEEHETSGNRKRLIWNDSLTLWEMRAGLRGAEFAETGAGALRGKTSLSLRDSGWRLLQGWEEMVAEWSVTPSSKLLLPESLVQKHISRVKVVITQSLTKKIIIQILFKSHPQMIQVRNPNNNGVRGTDRQNPGAEKQVQRSY